MLSSKLNLRGLDFTRTRRTFAIVAALFAVCFLFNVSGVYAVTFVVNSTTDANDINPGDGTCSSSAVAAICTLRAAITEANALGGPDIITLPAGTYTETLLGAGQTSENANAGGDFDITSDITINGAGAASTIVQANAASGVATERVFHIRGATTATALTVVIDGVTVQNGRNAGNVFGGGIRIDQGTNHNVTISNSTVTNNLNDSSGGGLAISTAVTPTVTITNCTFSNNRAGSATAATSAIGGGIQINSASTVNITNTAINSNIATTSIATGSFGGGIGVSTTGGVALTITGGTINNNTNTNTTAGGVGYGGGMFFRDGNLIMNGTTVSGNSTSGSGGGIAYWGSTATARTLSLTNVTIDNNTANNTGEAGAGGINFDVFGAAASTLNITDSSITNNISTAGAGGFGGGLQNWSEAAGGATTNITNSTISGNRVTFGGGIFNRSDGAGNGIVNLSRSAVTGNNSNGNGGGIYNFAVSTTGGLATVTLNNSTVGANTSAANGGGITNEINTGATATGPTVNLNYSTVASNTATTSGGGLQQLSGAINIQSSIVADNTAPTGPDIIGTITSQNYNHVENTAGGTFVPMANDVTGSDPQLTALALNGGTTPNYLPAMTSPVIDTIPSGTNGCGTTYNVDQRNVTRPTDSDSNAVAACEKGSVEVLAPTAAMASVSGRVLAGFDGRRGVANATVTMTDAAGVTRFARTNAFGYFQMADVATGQTYIFDVSAKRYQFQTQVVNVSNDLTDLNFIPLYSNPRGIK